MISPASGIHRPSYNGAPAKQTMKNNYLDLFHLIDVFAARCNVRGAAPRRSRRVYKSN